jgi:acyl carrier protein
MNEIKQEVRQFLSELLPDGKMSNLHDDTPLRTSGILDSTAVLQLVSMVEAKFGIEVSAYEAGVENFDRVDDIAAFVQRKLVARASAS